MSAPAPHTDRLHAWLAATEERVRTAIAALVSGDAPTAPDARPPATSADAAAPVGEPLVAWAGLGMDQVERIDSFLAPVLRAEGAAAVDRYPAVVLASLVGRAARIAATTDMWNDWPAGLGLEKAEQGVAAAVDRVAETLPDILAEFGLQHEAMLDGDPGEPGTPEHSALLALVNAGVQQSVVPFIIEKIEAAAGIEAGMSASDLVQSIAPVGGRAEELVAGFAVDADGDIPRGLRLLAATAPVRARGLVEALAGYLAATAADPANWESRVDLGADDLGIPPLLFDAAREELRARPAGTPGRRTAVGSVATTGRPQLYFDEVSGSVCVQLPTPADPAGRRWTVTYAGTVVTRRARALGDRAGRPVVELTEPCRDVLVELGEDRHWVVPAVDTADPVLIFGADGQSVTGKASLHSTSAHVVFPSDARIIDPATGRDVPFLEDPVPARWDLWKVGVLDLRDVLAVQVVRPGVEGVVRSASPQRRPRLTTPGAVLDGALTVHGTPIHASGPVAVFPPTLSGRSEPWRVQLANFEGHGAFSGDVVMEYELEVPADGGEVEILTDDDYPWLGEFVVRLTNPRGRSFSAHFAVAEQAHLTVDARGGGDGFRIPEGAGLTPAEVRVVSGDKPLTAEPAVLRLGADEARGVIELSTEEGAWLEVHVTPAVLSFTIPMNDESAQERTRTLRTRADRLDAHGEFRISAPGELRHAHLSVRSGERDICRVPVDRRGDDGAADLGSHADRVAMLSEVTISLDWTRTTGRRRMSVPLVVAPATDPVRSWESDGTRFSVDLAEDARGLPGAVWFWRTDRPWDPPAVAEVVDGSGELPEAVAEAPSAMAQFIFGAPGERRPTWPTGSAVLVEITGGEGAELTEPDPHDLRGIWSLLASWRAGRAPKPAGAGALTAERLRELAVGDPRAGLAALNSTSIALADQPGLVISSGLVLGDFTAVRETPGRRRVPWLGTLAALADLSGAAAAGDGAMMEEQLDYIRGAAGDALLSVLRTGQDATLESATIDQSSVQITALPAAQADAILAQVFDGYRMVPGPLTDDDARFTAIHEVVASRAAIVESGLMTDLAKKSRALFQAVTKVSPRLRRAVNVRFHKLDGIDADDPSLHWTLVPGTSLLIAVAARAIARRNAQLAAEGAVPADQAAEGQQVLHDDSVVRELLFTWAALADLVPTLVMGDLLIADALVAHVLGGDLTAVPEPVEDADAE